MANLLAISSSLVVLHITAWSQSLPWNSLEIIRKSTGDSVKVPAEGRGWPVDHGPAVTSREELRCEHDAKIQRLFEKAEKFSCHGKHKEAAKLLALIVTNEPAYSAARNNLALEYDALGDTDRAISELRVLVAATPTFTLANTNLAVILCNAHRYQEAEEVARQVIQGSGPSPRACLILAVILIREKEYTPELRSNLECAAARYEIARTLHGSVGKTKLNSDELSSQSNAGSRRNTK